MVLQNIVGKYFKEVGSNKYWKIVGDPKVYYGTKLQYPVIACTSKGKLKKQRNVFPISYFNDFNIIYYGHHTNKKDKSVERLKYLFAKLKDITDEINVLMKENNLE